MNKIINFGGVIALIVAIIVRYYLTQHTWQAYLDVKNLQHWEIWFYVIAIVWFVIAFWNVLLRRRCPNCRSSNYEFNGSEEIDRWVGTKKVRVKVGENSYTNHTVSTTYVKIRNLFQCLQCGHSWAEEYKKEKA